MDEAWLRRPTYNVVYVDKTLSKSERAKGGASPFQCIVSRRRVRVLYF